MGTTFKCEVVVYIHEFLSFSADPTMPTLSPHPPPSNTSVGDPTTPAALDSLDVKPNIADLMGPKSISSLNNQVCTWNLVACGVIQEM